MMRRGLAQVLASVMLMLSLSSCAREPVVPKPVEPDYGAIEVRLLQSIAAVPELDSVRAVLVAQGGKSRISLYRHGFTSSDHEHVFSVTKGVVSLLVGIAVADGLIRDVNEPLSVLLPQYSKVMAPAVAEVTLRQLLSMTAGFEADVPPDAIEKIWPHQEDVVSYILSESQAFPVGQEFRYSNISAHLVAAVLAAALQRGGEDQSVLDYARVKLFDPLGIQTRPAYDQPLPLQLEGSAFARASFGWGTDPQRIHIGAFGLRLTAPDMLKLGELCRASGHWNGEQLVPAAWISESTTSTPSTPMYGYFWWVDEVDGHPHFFAAGSQGQRIVVVPDLGLVMVVLSATYEPPRMGEGIVPVLVEQVITSVG